VCDKDLPEKALTVGYFLEPFPESPKAARGNGFLLVKGFPLTTTGPL